MLLSFAGLIVVYYAEVTIVDYGQHINRTFDRAEAARRGESSPQLIWAAGNKGEVESPWWRLRSSEITSLPRYCHRLQVVVGSFAFCFLALIIRALFAMLGIGICKMCETSDGWS